MRGNRKGSIGQLHGYQFNANSFGKDQEIWERLVEWSKHSFCNIRRQLEEKTKELIKAELAAASGSDINMVRVIQVEVNELLKKESLIWQQRARSLFLKFGNRNICYFH